MFKSIKYLKWSLLPFGIIHLWIVILRNKLFDWQIFKSRRLPKPVISIGNIQLGGTSKTPLTIHILKKLQNEGFKVGILSRGYKRKSNEEIILKSNDEQNKDFYPSIGDEPAIFLNELKNGILGIGGNRYGLGLKMLEENEIDLFLLDDALQHRNLQRDLDICLIDVSHWRRHPFLFPLSYLRDCKSSLKRCHAVILTKIGVEVEKAKKIKDTISDKFNIPVFEGDLEAQSLSKIEDGSATNLTELNRKKVAAFCGIAHPNHFFSMLEQVGADVVLEKRFPDHYHYHLGELQQLGKIIEERGIHTAITTEKDAVKLDNLIQDVSVKDIEFYYLKVEFKIKEMTEFYKLFVGLLSSKSFEQY
jgi:tetraacyldisaccharide 4'-kinase